MKPLEIWKDVVGYEGLYQISNLGRVKSLDRYIQYKDGRRQLHKGKILSPYIDNNGYATLQLGRKSHEKVHRLVALAFVINSNPNKFNVVNHIDENPQNNSADNLEWCTQAYNMEYSNVHEKCKKSLSRAILQIDFNGVIVNRFSSLCEVSRNGFNKRNVWRSLKTDISSKGYKFIYE